MAESVFNDLSGGTSYKDVIDRITYRYKKSKSYNSARIVGLIFGKRNSKTITEWIEPNLDYWHYRSEDYIDFFCIGFYYGEFVPVGSDGFDAQAFNNTIRQFEKNSKWRYKGETEILLLNAHFNSDIGRAELDFTNVMSLTLERAIEKKAIQSIPAFFDQVITNAEKFYGNTNPVSDMSDLLGARIALVDLLICALSFLPGKLSETLEKLLFFYTRDVSKPQADANV